MSTVVRWLHVFGVLSYCLVLAVQPARAQTTYQFDLPSQQLADSLRAFGHQTSTSILFEPALVKGLTSASLKGSFTPDAALTELLAGTLLRYEFINDNTVAIHAAKTQERNSKKISTRDQS